MDPSFFPIPTGVFVLEWSAFLFLEFLIWRIIGTGWERKNRSPQSSMIIPAGLYFFHSRTRWSVNDVWSDLSMRLARARAVYFCFLKEMFSLLTKKTQIELVGLVSTISICRLIVCFLSERSWSLCTHTWNCPYRMYRLFSFVWPFSRFYSKRLPLFVFFFVLSSKLLLWLLLLLNIARSTDDGHENLTHAPNECVWNENKLEMKIEENPGTFSRHDQSLNYF